MRVLITGGAGFIGSNLCRRLGEERPADRVTVLDDLSTGSAENLAGLDVELGGPIGDVSRASVRIRKGSLTERVHQFGRASSADRKTEPGGSTPPTASD